MFKANSRTIQNADADLPVWAQTLLWLPKNLGYLLFWLLSHGMALTAAIAKGLGYAYGTLILIAFFETTNLAIVGSFLTWPYLILGGVIATSILLLSLAMEGRKTAKNVYRVYDHLPQRLSDLKAYFETYYWNEVSWRARIKNIFIELLSFAYLLAPGAGTAKGASMAAGTIGMSLAFLHLVGQPLTDPALCLITLGGLIAGGCVGSVSFVGKEGPKFKKHIDRAKKWLRGKAYTAELAEGPFTLWALVVAGFVPFVAALAKALAYSFGTLTLIAFFTVGPNMYANSVLIFSAAVLTPQHLLLVGAVALSVFCVSLGMEGLYTADKVYKLWTGKPLRKVKEKQKSAESPRASLRPSPDSAQTTWKKCCGKILHVLLDTARYITLLGPVSKGASMMSGTIGMLIAVSMVGHWNLSIIAITGFAIFLGAAATVVSLGKEWSDDLNRFFDNAKKLVTKNFFSANSSSKDNTYIHKPAAMTSALMLQNLSPCERASVTLANYLSYDSPVFLRQDKIEALCPQYSKKAYALQCFSDSCLL